MCSFPRHFVSTLCTNEGLTSTFTMYRPLSLLVLLCIPSCSIAEADGSSKHRQPSARVLIGMPKARKLSPQSVWDLPALQAALEEAGVGKPEHHATKLLSFLIRNPDATWHDAPDFPKSAIACLDRYFCKFTSSLLAVQRSDDGATVKLLLKLQDGLRIEAVVMQYDTRETNPDTGDVLKGQVRSTLCVSSQVGCQMGCTFCATGAAFYTLHLSNLILCCIVYVFSSCVRFWAGWVGAGP